MNDIRWYTYIVRDLLAFSVLPTFFTVAMAVAVYLSWSMITSE